MNPQQPIPELVALPHAPGLVKVWCKYCRRCHYHSPDFGHRVAHCILPSSPYKQTGYIIRPVGSGGSK